MRWYVPWRASKGRVSGCDDVSLGGSRKILGQPQGLASAPCHEFVEQHFKYAPGQGRRNQSKRRFAAAQLAIEQPAHPATLCQSQHQAGATGDDDQRQTR